MTNKLNIIAPINKLSYGYVAANLVKTLDKVGIEVSLFPIGDLIETETWLKPSIDRALLNRQAFSEDSPTLIIWHHFGLAEFRKFKGKHYGFPIFEVNEFGGNDVDNLNSMDGLFTTCAWYKRVLEKYTKKAVQIANLGCDQEIFKRDIDNEYKKNINPEKVKFLCMGKWEIRKGHYEMLTAISELVNRGSLLDAEFTFACNNPFLSTRENQKWTEWLDDKTKGKLRIINDRMTSHVQVAELMREHHCGIFLSKAEGWNMEAHELATLNIPSIITNYSAHTEFCNSDNSFLIDIPHEEAAYDGKWFFGQGTWAKLDEQVMEDFKRKLLDFYKEKINNRGNLRDCAVSVSHLTWDNTAKSILDLMREEK